MAKKRTQEERVLDYIQDFGSITTWEAFRDLGITRLSAKIFNLRKLYDIEGDFETDINRYGERVRFKRYKLKED